LPRCLLLLLLFVQCVNSFQCCGERRSMNRSKRTKPTREPLGWYHLEREEKRKKRGKLRDRQTEKRRRKRDKRARTEGCCLSQKSVGGHSASKSLVHLLLLLLLLLLLFFASSAVSVLQFTRFYNTKTEKKKTRISEQDWIFFRLFLPDISLLSSKLC
jgi:hypothetical protein